LSRIVPALGAAMGNSAYLLHCELLVSELGLDFCYATKVLEIATNQLSALLLVLAQFSQRGLANGLAQVPRVHLRTFCPAIDEMYVPMSSSASSAQCLAHDDAIRHEAGRFLH
jgi:hypothetical protein